MTTQRHAAVRRLGALVGALGLLLWAVCSAQPAGAVTASPATVKSPAAAIAQPPNLLAGADGAAAASVSCTAPGLCEAIGAYSGPGADDFSVLDSTSTGGVFSGAQQVVTAVPNESTVASFAVLESIRCSTPGNCVGVGSYVDVSGNEEPFFGVQSNGGWTFQDVTTPSSPSGEPQLAALLALTCQSASSCVAVGDYRNSSNIEWPLVATLAGSGSSWTGSAVGLGLPSDADQSTTTGGAFYGVSCPSATSCVAVGAYDTSSTTAIPMVDVGTGSNWTTEAMQPPTSAPTGDEENASLNDVSCVSATSCFAVGQYIDSGNVQQAMVAETLGSLTTWIPVLAQLPTGALANPSAQLDAISCWGIGQCEAVGQFAGPSGKAGLIVDSPNGGWLPGVGVTAPSGSNSELSAVSCSSDGQCTALGDFNDGIPSEQLMSLTIGPPVVITTNRLPAGTVHHRYKSTLKANGGSGTYTWQVSGKLPAGVHLNGATGLLSGTPTRPGTFKITARAADAGPPAQTVVRRLSIVVRAG